MSEVISKSRTIVANKERFSENVVALAVNYLISNDKDFVLSNV